jgi:PKHD-type hydroxylase
MNQPQRTGQATGVEPYMVWSGGFNDAELDRIVAYGDSLGHNKATIKDRQNEDAQSDIRVTRVAWMEPTPESLWLFDKMAAITKSLNEQSYLFDLSALERMQYTVYTAGEGGHYDWHVDQGAMERRRKLSLVLQLTAPTDYEGCDLEIRSSNKIEPAPRARGALIAFPSYVLHRVTPITKGTRRSLVMWCSGPRFR